MDQLIGTQLKGYDIQDYVGEGGMGKVYLAYQSTLGRQVAIKIIKAGFANQPDFIRRFETEAQLVARLEHPYIVPLFDYWRDPEGAYLVMRYLQAGSLKDRLGSAGPFNLESAASLIDQIAGALTVAHRNLVIHRDIKPANILLDDDGNAYLTDFGIAKQLGGAEDTTLDNAGMVGSPDYLSPEQARNEEISPRTDMYSLGVVLYEILAGQHPFPGHSPVERLFKHINHPLPELTTVDDRVRTAVNDVIQKATAKNPMQRYEDVIALAAAFRNAAGLSASRIEPGLVELLTPREQEILKLLIEGKTNREIAEALTVELSTIKWYNNQIYQKLNVRSRVQAIVKARELNLIVDGFIRDDTTTFSSLPEPDNPFKGLRAFTAADAQDFFGRERMVRKLLNRMGQDDRLSRFLAVVGPSGSGKSSLVRAGLVPALWRGDLDGSDNWYTVDLLPGSHPLDELEVALTRVATEHGADLGEHLQRDERGLLRATNIILPDDGSELLVVIDQFEEVFTLVEDEARRQHFLDLIYTAVTDPRSRVRVVVSLRADFYDRPLQYPRFGELVRDRMETVLPLGAEELEQAIVKPADRVGVSYEEGLVPLIIEDVHYQAGALPLLQYALTELFEERDKRTLTHAGYQAIGRAVGALAARAEQTHHEFDEAGQEAIHQMFLRLVTLGEGVEDTRRRVNRRELLDIATDSDVMDEVIDTYAAYRLLALDYDPATRRPTVEVAHEALLREWDRLREWLNQSRDDIRHQRDLARAAERWESEGRLVGYLISEEQLTKFEVWRQTTGLALTRLEEEFLKTSLETEKARKTHEEAQERRSRTLLQALVAVFAVAALVAGGLALFAFDQQREANQQRLVAEDNFERAESQRLSAVSSNLLLGQRSPEVAALLALQALKIQHTEEADLALQRAAEADFGRRLLIPEQGFPGLPAFSRDGRFMTSFTFGSGDLRSQMWEVSTGELMWDLPDQVLSGNPWVATPFIAGDSAVVGVTDRFMTFVVMDPATGEILHTLLEAEAPIAGWDVSPNGQMVGTIQENGTLHVWDAFTYEVLLTDTLDFEEEGQGTARFSPDNRLFAARITETTGVWDLASGEQTHYLTNELQGHTPLTFSNDGRLLVTDLPYIWDLETSELVQTDVPGNYTYALSPDNRTFAIKGGSGGADIILWDLPTNTEIRRMVANGTVWALQFSSDGNTLLSGDSNASVEIWDVASGERLRSLRGHDDTIDYVIYSPDEELIVSVGDPGLRVWDAQPADELSRLLTQARQMVIRSPDGKTVLTRSLDRSQLVLLDAETAETIHRWDVTVTILTGSTANFMFSDDGSRIHWTEAGAILQYDVETGELVSSFEVPGSSFLAGSYVPGMNAILTSASDATYLLDADTGEVIRTYSYGDEAFDGFANFSGYLAVSPDGRYGTVYRPPLGVDSIGGLHVWDLATGEELHRIYRTVVVEALTFSHDSQLLAYGGNRDSAVVIDMESGEVVREIPQPDSVLALAFSPDDRYLLIGGIYSNAVVVDLETGETIRSLYGDDQAVGFFAEFLPDGQSVLMERVGSDNLIRHAPLSLDELVADVCDRVLRDLSEEERTIYGLDDTPTCPKFAADGTPVDPTESRLPGRVPTAALIGVGVLALGAVVLRRH